MISDECALVRSPLPLARRVSPISQTGVLSANGIGRWGAPGNVGSSPASASLGWDEIPVQLVWCSNGYTLGQTLYSTPSYFAPVVYCNIPENHVVLVLASAIRIP